jgi:hypothetical protein
LAAVGEWAAAAIVARKELHGHCHHRTRLRGCLRATGRWGETNGPTRRRPLNCCQQTTTININNINNTSNINTNNTTNTTNTTNINTTTTTNNNNNNSSNNDLSTQIPTDVASSPLAAATAAAR